jgi:hypothetical protein
LENWVVTAGKMPDHLVIGGGSLCGLFSLYIV